MLVGIREVLVVATVDAVPSVRSHVLPLYAAGFVTAAGSMGVAATVGADHERLGMSLPALGLFLALYDLAEIVLKPVFGAITDRVGVKPVIVAGLLLFTAGSLLGIWVSGPWLLGIVRVVQGVAASAFSPAASAGIALLAPHRARGTYFGKYGSWKGLGYSAGPLIGAAAILLGSARLLFAALAVIAGAAAVFAVAALPAARPPARTRATLADLGRTIARRAFLAPIGILAASTAILGTLTGDIPALGHAIGLPVLIPAAAVTLLAVTSAIVQPYAGRRHDAGVLSARTAFILAAVAMTVSLALLTLLPSAVTMLLGGILAGTGIGIATPIGFASLAATAPANRVGRTMGAAELGREAGESAGPLIVSALIPVLTLPGALLTLGALPLLATIFATTSRTPTADQEH